MCARDLCKTVRPLKVDLRGAHGMDSDWRPATQIQLELGAPVLWRCVGGTVGHCMR